MNAILMSRAAVAPLAARRVGLSSNVSHRYFSLGPLKGQISQARLTKQQSLPRSILQQSFRRSYADAPAAPAAPAAPTATLSPPPAPKPKRRFRFFRFLWRLTYLSVIGGAAYLAYTIYDLNHPNEQLEPDPKKKNLVILGEARLLTILMPYSLID